LTEPGNHESYVTAKHKLFGWFIRDVIIFPKVPSLYLYHQAFQSQGTVMRRYSLFALLSLDEVAQRVRFYENTYDEYVEDCYQRIATTQCHLEPILIGYNNPSIRLENLVSRVLEQPPLFSFGEQGMEDQVFQVPEPSLIEHVEASLQGEKFFLLDGHHRLKAALRYRDEQKAAKGASYTGKEPWNFVLVSIINMADDGFSLVVPSRLLKEVSLPIQDAVKQIGASFNLAAIPFQDALTEKAARKKLGMVLAEYQAKKVVAFGFSVAQASSRYFVAVGGSGLSSEVVDRQVIQGIFGLQPRYPSIHYESNWQRAFDKVKNRLYQIAFFPQSIPLFAFVNMNPNQVFAPRSFDFVPKVPSGIVLYSFKYSL